MRRRLGDGADELAEAGEAVDLPRLRVRTYEGTTERDAAAVVVDWPDDIATEPAQMIDDSEDACGSTLVTGAEAAALNEVREALRATEKWKLAVEYDGMFHRIEIRDALPFENDAGQVDQVGTPLDNASSARERSDRALSPVACRL